MSKSLESLTGTVISGGEELKLRCEKMSDRVDAMESLINDLMSRYGNVKPAKD